MLPDVKYYMGVDGGGTRCRVRLKNADGLTLGEATGGPANIRLGLPEVWLTIKSVIDKALGQAGLSVQDYSALSVGLGLAGITTEADCVRTITAGPRFAKTVAASDAHAACLGAFTGKNGAILISGTGSAGYAWVDGVGHTVGGWGFEICDEGSAASLGRESISAALRSYDGLAAETEFTRAIIGHFGGTPSAIVAWVNSAKPADYGTLAPIATTFAEAGDRVAAELVRQCAQQIDRYVAQLHHIGAPHICLLGGMSKPLHHWLNTLTQSMLIAPQHDAVDGALLMAGLPADKLAAIASSPPQSLQLAGEER